MISHIFFNTFHFATIRFSLEETIIFTFYDKFIK